MRYAVSTLAVLALAGAGAHAQAKFTLFGVGCKGSGLLPGPCRVLPSAYANKMGQGANTWPHARLNMRYQQVFLGSELGAPGLFTELCLRLDERSGGPAQTQQVELLLGHTSQTPATMSATFASNYTSGPPTSLFKGQISMPQHAGGGTTTDFKICIKFTTPWLWTVNTAAPNLLFEMLNTSSSSKNHFEDFCTGAADCTTTRVAAGVLTSPSGTAFTNQGLVMCLRGLGQPGAIPALMNNGLPIIGQSFDVQLANARQVAPCVLYLGGRISVPLPPALAPGCSLYQDLLTALGVVASDAGGDASQKLAIPNNPGLKGAKFTVQWLVLDAAANTLGIAFSDGGEAEIG